jgi:hypothetical protein
MSKSITKYCCAICGQSAVKADSVVSGAGRRAIYIHKACWEKEQRELKAMREGSHGKSRA